MSSKMFINSLLFFIFFLLPKVTISTSAGGFTFNGFSNSNMSLDGFASITPDGLLALTNITSHTQGHAFHPIPRRFKPTAAGKVLSFSTTFAIAIVPELINISCHGLALVISPTSNFSSALPLQYLGLFNEQDNGSPLNHIFAVEFDTIQNPEFLDIDGNHVGIDMNSLLSNKSSSAGYFEDGTGSFKNMSLISGQPMQVWVDYNGTEMQLNVTMSPLRMSKPSKPLLSSTIDLSSLMLDSMYVGFSSSTGYLIHTSHYILGWSFKMNGTADPLDYAKLPSLPLFETKGSTSQLLVISLPVASGLLLLLVAAAVIVLVAKRRVKDAELVEDWELDYGPHRFSYKDLYQATKGFVEKELLGGGGFGRVYKGVLPSSKMEVAVKKVSHESRQGIKAFVAEIVSIGQLRHRNIVQLFGYCRRKGERLLVYEFMPNGSLDRFLYDGVKPTLNWAQRFHIIRGVASGLWYLHENWEQVVVHGDIKASNVLLDSEFNGRLGDFGLARLYNHGTDPHTTHVVGTIGYVAPELSRRGKATTATDVFAFGAFLLEVACGRRPVEPEAQGVEVMLVGWVLACWQKGSVLETRDSRLGEEYSVCELELVLKLGLLCSNPKAVDRPNMRQVVQILEGEVTLPELPESYLGFCPLSIFQGEGVDGYINCFPSPMSSLSGISTGR